MMRILTISLLFFLLAINAHAQMADDIIGDYILPNNIEVEIFKQNGKYFGKITGLNNFKNGQKKDINNPDKSKRDDSLLGKVIIENLEIDSSEKQWKNGTIYSAEKGLVLDFKITAIRNNEIEVVGSKYIFRKTLIWLKE